MDPRLTYGSLLVPSVPASAAAAAAVAAGLHHHQSHLHPFHSQLAPSVHHLAHSLHPFGSAAHQLQQQAQQTQPPPPTPPKSQQHQTPNPSNSKSGRTSSAAANINPNTGKPKRARQRVDAGEPRNSYASITNFSSTRSSAFHHPGKSHLPRSSSSSMFKSSNPKSSTSTSQQHQQLNLSKSQSSGLSYALNPTSTSACSSCSFCTSSNTVNHSHPHRTGSHPHHHLSPISHSGGSGISGSLAGAGGVSSGNQNNNGIPCNNNSDRNQTSQYKERNIKQQNDNHLVPSLTSSNMNHILGGRSVHPNPNNIAGTPLGILDIKSSIHANNSNSSNLDNSMYHNGQSATSPPSTSASLQQQPLPLSFNYENDDALSKRSSCKSANKSSVPSSSTSPLNECSNLFTSSSAKSTGTPASEPTKESANDEIPSSAHLLRVILQKGKRSGSNGSGGYNKSSNQVNCDKSGSNCESTSSTSETTIGSTAATTVTKTKITCGSGNGSNEDTEDDNDEDFIKDEDDEDEEKVEEDEDEDNEGNEDRHEDEHEHGTDETTDSGRTITGSSLNNGEEGGDKVVDPEDDNGNNNNNSHNNNMNDDNNNNGDKRNEIVDDLDVTEEDENDDEDDDDDEAVTASCSVDSEGEPDGVGGGASGANDETGEPVKGNTARSHLDSQELPGSGNEESNLVEMNVNGPQRKRKVEISTSSSTSSFSSSSSSSKSNNNNKLIANCSLSSTDKGIIVHPEDDNHIVHEDGSIGAGGKSDSNHQFPTSNEIVQCDSGLPSLNSGNNSGNHHQVASSLLSSSASSTSSSSSSASFSVDSTTASLTATGPTLSDVKRARVENIVTNMLPRSSGSISGQQQVKSPIPQATEELPHSSSLQQPEREPSSAQQQTQQQQVTSAIVNGCKKRKLYHPQQSKSNGSLDDEEDDLLDEMVGEDEDEFTSEMIGDEDELNDSLIGLSNSNEFEMSEINDLSLKSTPVKCENMKSEYPLTEDGITSTKETSSLTHEQDYHHHHRGRKGFTKGNGEEFEFEEELTSVPRHRTSHGPASRSHHHRRFGGNDPQDLGSLLNVAQKYADEQEKMLKLSSDSHHSRHSRSSRKRSLLPASSPLTTTSSNTSSALVNGSNLLISSESSLITGQPCTSPLLLYSDIEWLRDTLKAETQANLIPSLNNTIDSVINRFCQRRAAAAAAQASRSGLTNTISHQQASNLSLQENVLLPLRGSSEDLTSSRSDPTSIGGETASKELTLLSQMLESKSSPRTNNNGKESSSSQSNHHSSHHHHHPHNKTTVPRDSPSQQNSSPSSSSSARQSSSTPSIRSNGKSPLNGQPQQSQSLFHPHSHPSFSHLNHHSSAHRVTSSSPSSFTLPTESAPVPKPSAPSPFHAFSSGFKPNLLFPNFPSGLPGAAAAAVAAAATSSAPPNLLHAASIAQHLNSFASVFHHHHQKQQQQQQQQQSLRSSDGVSMNENSPSVGQDQSTPTSFLGNRENQSSSAREGSPDDSEHARASSALSDPVSGDGEQTEAISLVVTPKRKRLKVTDSKMTPRTVSRILIQEPLLSNLMGRTGPGGELSSPPPTSALNFGLSSFNGSPHLVGPPTAPPPPPLVPVSLSTSVAMPNPGLHSAELFGGSAFPFSDHARLLRESLFAQALRSSGGAQGSEMNESNENPLTESPINDSHHLLNTQQKQPSKLSSQQLSHSQADQEEQGESQLPSRGGEETLRSRHHHHPSQHHHHSHSHHQHQQAAAVAAAAAAAAAAAQQQHHHHQAAAAAIQNALAANHLAMLAQANRAAGGGDTASPESLSQFGGTRSENGADGSESLNDSTGFDTSTPLMSYCGSQLALQTTLTPMHLRKAKLMFFYVRYPSSNVLKTFFPDIKFHKNNTAQLVKWFSNFREFYYIQMEKYARQAISEGIKSAEEIHIHKESELLRVLNMHYNRSNHLEVPDKFCFVVEQTLREFFKSILAGKDTEQSWKKAIYKIISRLDDSVPEYFKSPNFLETLE